VALGAAVIVLNLAAAALACGTENSNCAGAPRLWRGRVYGQNGAPARSATVLYTFASNQPRGRPLGRELAINTDEAGRYCLRWPDEKITAALRAADVVAGPTPDPRLRDIAPRAPGPIIVTPDAVGGVARAIAAPGTHEVGVLVVADPWEPALDATSSCVERSPHWSRLSNLTSNWRFRLLLALGALALILGLIGLFAGPALRPALPISAAVAGAAAGALFVLVWVTESV
jgi:hypothetical protein